MIFQVVDHYHQAATHEPLHVRRGRRHGAHALFRFFNRGGAALARAAALEIRKNGKEYAPEIVVREKDWTILHFLFK